MKPDAEQVTGVWATAHRYRRVLGIAGAATSAGMTVLWIVVVPEKADATGNVQEFAIRWAHPACWALLTTVGILVASDAPKRVRNPFAYAAAACYAAFVAATLM